MTRTNTLTKPASPNRKTIKLVRNYEGKDGKQQSRFDTVGFLQTAPETGKIEFYVDIPLLGQKLVVFRNDNEDDGDEE